MKVRVDGSGLKIGVDNALTEALLTGKWGVSLLFTNDNNDGRFEFVLSIDEASDLVAKLTETINSIEQIKTKMKQE